MLTVITLTGARPEGFSLLSRCLQRQTYTKPIRWIVIDDCEPVTPVPKMPKNWTVFHVKRRPAWQAGQNTQHRNMQLALSAVEDEERVVIAEDDDFYGPEWLAKVADGLKRSELVGLASSRKYNIATRRAIDKSYGDHASLCCTAVRGDALKAFRRIAQGSTKLMDLELWRGRSGLLLPGNDVVSLKCLPGRDGIDSGHLADFGEIEDADGELLRQWIGVDADDYLALSPNIPRNRVGRHTKETKPMALSREGEIARYIEAHDDPARRMHMGARRKVDVTRIINALPKGTLLDVGTGQGEALEIARAAGHEPHGCDANPKVAGKYVTTCDAHDLLFSDGEFDHVTCFDVLEHLIEEDIRPALREMFRVARKTVTVSASELPSPDGKGGDFHISKRPRAEWLKVIRECWGASAHEFGKAGASPAFRVEKP